MTVEFNFPWNDFSFQIYPKNSVNFTFSLRLYFFYMIQASWKLSVINFNLVSSSSIQTHAIQEWKSQNVKFFLELMFTQRQKREKSTWKAINEILTSLHTTTIHWRLALFFSQGSVKKMHALCIHLSWMKTAVWLTCFI